MTKPLKILIVEDSENDALLMVSQLRRHGYLPTYERVDSAKEMRRALQNADWDVVLTDYSLPGFTGLDALNILKEMDIDLPFIVVSGTIGEDLAVAAMKAGAQDYIMKDNMTRLGAAVERELREAEIRRARRRAEMALKETNQILWDLIQSSPLAIVAVDEQRNITVWNPAAERMFGWSKEEVLGASLPIVPKDKHPEFRELLSSAFEGKSTANLETQRRRRDGSLIYVSLNMAPLHNSTGDIVGAMAIIADLTDRKRSEGQKDGLAKKTVG